MNPFALTTLVCLLLGNIWLMTKLLTIVWDAATELTEHPWHPVKLGLRVVVIVVSLAAVVGLLFFARFLLLTIGRGGA